ncbi:hypothetical protein AB6809_29365 [Paraburkholderia sp. RCC_158]|uniref:hypothetical protein n=1 Tax=Paraburkholderia sp. RCC_158 TaxID=3239220 RepID=UPI003525E5CF
MNLTIKQIEIMKVVVAGAAAGAVVDLDQLLERLPYATSKESLQFSLRAIERHQLIDRSVAEHRRGRVRRLIAPTALGHAVIGGTGRPAPGPGAAVGAAAAQVSGPSIKEDAPQVSGSAALIPELDMGAAEVSLEPQLLSLPELTFPEPQVFFEEEIID